MQSYGGVDIAKFLFSLVVIGIHTRPFSGITLFGLPVNSVVFPIAVPFFFFCAGYFLMRGASGGGRVFTKRRRRYLLKIAFLYLAAELLYLPFVSSIWFDGNPISGTQILWYLEHQVIFGSFEHLWYLYALFFGAALHMALVRLLGMARRCWDRGGGICGRRDYPYGLAFDPGRRALFDLDRCAERPVFRLSAGLVWGRARGLAAPGGAKARRCGVHGFFGSVLDRVYSFYQSVSALAAFALFFDAAACSVSVFAALGAPHKEARRLFCSPGKQYDQLYHPFLVYTCTATSIRPEFAAERLWFVCADLRMLVFGLCSGGHFDLPAQKPLRAAQRRRFERRVYGERLNGKTLRSSAKTQRTAGKHFVSRRFRASIAFSGIL